MVSGKDCDRLIGTDRRSAEVGIEILRSLLASLGGDEVSLTFIQCHLEGSTYGMTAFGLISGIDGDGRPVLGSHNTELRRIHVLGVGLDDVFLA